MSVELASELDIEESTPVVVATQRWSFGNNGDERAVRDSSSISSEHSNQALHEEQLHTQPASRRRSVSTTVYNMLEAARRRILRLTKPRRHTVGPVISSNGRGSSSNSIGRKKTILGCPLLPDTLVDTAHLSILNYPAKNSGFITDVTIRLGGSPPGNGRDWEVRTYAQTTKNVFKLIACQSICVNIETFAEQTIKLAKPLKMEAGQYVGILNKSGRLSLTYNRGWMLQNSPEGLQWDLWYTEYTPPSELNSATSALLMWSGKVGWYATLEENPPPPDVNVLPSSLVSNLLLLLQDDSSKDFTFIVKSHDDEISTEIRAHKALLIARSQYFRALLQSKFSESHNNMDSLVIDMFPAYAFAKMIEYLYTDTYDISDVNASQRLRTFTDICRVANHYCLERLVSLTEKKMIDCLTPDNVGDVYVIAKSFNAKQLKSYCHYFCLRYESDIIETVNRKNATVLAALASLSSAENLQEECSMILREARNDCNSSSSSISTGVNYLFSDYEKYDRNSPLVQIRKSLFIAADSFDIGMETKKMVRSYSESSEPSQALGSSSLSDFERE